jgi:predicted peptidase
MSIPEMTVERLAEFPPVWRAWAEQRVGFVRDDSACVLHKVFALLDQLGEEFPIDADRVYVLGHSMGGFGTFEALAEQPERFAAAIPSAGGMSPWHDVSAFDDVPF